MHQLFPPRTLNAKKEEGRAGLAVPATIYGVTARPSRLGREWCKWKPRACLPGLDRIGVARRAGVAEGLNRVPRYVVVAFAVARKCGKGHMCFRPMNASPCDNAVATAVKSGRQRAASVQPAVGIDSLLRGSVSVLPPAPESATRLGTERTTPPTEHELMARAAVGDRAAFGELARKARPTGSCR